MHPIAACRPENVIIVIIGDIGYVFGVAVH